ncbi:MAG: polyribonucleotide nucleotidyltransferase [Candidatus Auribacterota bacterium]|nr:polyribonucleotide nucleotidyltransferase [Candidatus Auribacterota bacterium]
MYSKEIEISGKKLIIETGKMAKQANGAVLVQYGETIVLATAVMADEVREGTDFFPLTVDYREKVSAAGKIPGGYIKREGRPTEKEILTARLTDRPIRPLFPDGMFNEVQIMISVLSADTENDPDILSMIGASAALAVSDIPFLKAVGAVRVGLVDGEFIINPTSLQLVNSKIDIVVAGSHDGVMMVEGEAKEVSEETMLDAIDRAHQEIKRIIALQNELRQLCGKEKREVPLITIDESLVNIVGDIAKDRLRNAVCVADKMKRQNELKSLCADVVATVLAKYEDQGEESPYKEKDIKQAFRVIEKKMIRKLILDENLRSDGRTCTDIRNITCEVGLLPRTHGSALFTRGETQSLVMTTLGSPGDEQRFEGLAGEATKKFMLHYNFPPFSVGECGPIRGPGRREIGHGILAERAISYVIPDEKDFPYTIRIVSDILESNGSSSMASVCGGTLSLMDAGVPIKSPVAGIAMGLVIEGDKVVTISDILGSEDACGDMDFKVAGTRDGITAFQMDLKIEGISRDVMRQAIYQARDGRLHILDIMLRTISEPRAELSEYAPRIVTMQIDPDKIGAVIGPGGKVIKKIIEDTGVAIDIDDDGMVHISSNNKDATDKAIRQIEAITAEVEVGKVYEGTVKNILDFGAFVEVLPGKEGLIHISGMSTEHIESPTEVMNTGDKIMVRVAEIDDRGRINLEYLVDGEPVVRHTSRSRDKGPRDGRPQRGGGHHRNNDRRPRR